MLSCSHADRLPLGHTAALRSSRLPADAFPLDARLLSRIGPLIALGGVMSSCCHAVIWATRGQQEDNKRRRGRQQEDTGLASAARGQKQDHKRRTQGWPARPEDNSRTSASARRTRGGHGVGQRGQRTIAGQLQAPGGQEEDKGRTRPGHSVQGRGQRLWPALFSKREPQQ